MSDLHHKRLQKVGLHQNVNYATLASHGINYETLGYDAGTTIFDPGVTVQSFDVTASAGMVAERNRSYTDSKSGLRVVPFSAVATRKDLAPHLDAALFGATQVASDPYQKVFTNLSGTVGFIDFVSNSARTYALASCPTGTMAAVDNEVLKHAIIDTLNLSFDFNGNGTGKLLKINGTWKGDEFTTAAALTGTWVAKSLQNFFNDSDTYTLQIEITGGVTLASRIKGNYTLNINNNVMPHNVSGITNGFRLNPSYSLNVNTPYIVSSNESYLLEAAYRNGSEIKVTLTSSISSGTVGHLQIITYGKMVQNPLVMNGDYFDLNLQMQLETPSSGSAIQITLADGVDRGYLAP